MKRKEKIIAWIQSPSRGLQISSSRSSFAPLHHRTHRISSVPEHEMVKLSFISHFLVNSEYIYYIKSLLADHLVGYRSLVAGWPLWNMLIICLLAPSK